MKNVYFIRHGESDSNAGDLYQGMDSQLTERGRQQANFVARRASALSADIILSSTAPRAKATAEAIKVVTGLPVEYFDFLVERRNPSSLLGLSKSDPDAKRIAMHIVEKYMDEDYRYEDAESFRDLKDRAAAVIDLLERRPEQEIIVVTHGWFLRMIVMSMIFGRSLTPDVFIRFFAGTETRNTGITLCDFDPKRAPNAWHLITWNDHAHLADN